MWWFIDYNDHLLAHKTLKWVGWKWKYDSVHPSKGRILQPGTTTQVQYGPVWNEDDNMNDMTNSPG